MARDGRFDGLMSALRETDEAILTPRYTREALWEMGMRRSYGESKFYRAAFAAGFRDAWMARYIGLTVKDAELVAA